jgi:hypothetical protein
MLKRFQTPTNVFLLFLFIAVILLRSVNLDITARFLWDESSDLVRMHGIYVDRDITLIGPISEDGNKVFSSLTYYMFMPFAILGSFDPVSPVWGASFWGIITVILLWIYFYRLRQQSVFKWCLVSSLVVIWTPLLLPSRWAWNPNLIPFWIILALLLLRGKRGMFKFLAGLALGMTVHHHYLSIIAVAVFLILILLWHTFKGATFKGMLLPFFLGITFSILPFVLFDLTHPPGLFLSRVLYFNYLKDGSGASGGADIIGIFINFIEYLGAVYWFKYLVSVLVVVLLIKDISARNKKALMYGFTWVFYIISLIVISNVYDHYYLPAVVFFLVWLFVSRKGKERYISTTIAIILLVGSAISIPRLLTEKSWESDMASTKNIVEIVEHEIIANDLINPNIAVLTSPDPNIYGRKYRDLMLIRENASIKTKDEYEITDNLFVVSYGSEEDVRADKAAEMNGFRGGVVSGNWEIENSPWKIYRFDRY